MAARNSKFLWYTLCRHLDGDADRAPTAIPCYVQAGLVYRSIKLHVRLHNWQRALDLARKHNQHVDTVLMYRRRCVFQAMIALLTCCGSDVAGLYRLAAVVINCWAGLALSAAGA